MFNRRKTSIERIGFGQPLHTDGSGVVPEGEIYGRGEWRPTFELLAPNGSAVVVYPGMVHERGGKGGTDRWAEKGGFYVFLLVVLGRFSEMFLIYS